MRTLLLFLLFALMVTGGRAAVPFDELAQEYRAHGGVELVADGAVFPVKLPAGPLTARNVARVDLDLYLLLFRKEFGKYPAELFPLAGLKRIVFCRELAFKGQMRTAVADPDNGVLYLDVRSGVFPPSYRRKMIHREFYRLIDNASRDGSGDAGWVALNPPGTLYGSGKVYPPGDNPGSVISHPTAGFLNVNSLSSVEEDKAEIFANLMVNDLKTRLLLRQDDVLVAKIQLLKQSLQQFCGKADAMFWTRVGKDF
jgi:hypothetical protein